MREKQVGVAVVRDEQGRFLLTWSTAWSCYAFPMKDVAPDQDVLPSTAVCALEDDLGQRLPSARARELGYLGKFGVSGRTDEATLYEYWAYEVLPGSGVGEERSPLARSASESAAPSLPDPRPPRWLSYDQLVADPEVGWSTQEIARAFVENQEVALAVITRLGAAETEYLLVENDNYGGFFFPAMRRKSDVKPEAAARAVVRGDLGYRGEALVRYGAEVPDAHASRRFERDRAYRFHICPVALPDLDLNQPLGFLERRLKARGLEGRWFTADELRRPPVPVSPTLAAVVATVLQVVPPVQRDQPLRRSEGSVALITRQVAGQTEWLARWNDHWGAFFFVGGHRREPETFRDGVTRETAEELGLAPGTDFTIAPASVARLDYVAHSRSAGTDTSYTIEAFAVRLVNEDAVRRVEADPKNRWLTAAEVARLEAFDARPVSVTLAMVLARAGVLEGW